MLRARMRGCVPPCAARECGAHEKGLGMPKRALGAKLGAGPWRMRVQAIFGICRSPALLA